MNSTDDGFSFSFHKNYKLGPTYPRLTLFSLRELNQTSPLIWFEGWNTFSVPSDSPENQTCNTNEGGASLACYQSTLFSGRSFKFQPILLYFPLSGQSTNEILWEINASFPFLCPSQPLASVFSRYSLHSPKEPRACSQGILIGKTILLQQQPGLILKIFSL